MFILQQTVAVIVVSEAFKPAVKPTAAGNSRQRYYDTQIKTNKGTSLKE